MKVVYIAGPFRAMNPDGTANQWEQEQNVRRAEALALAVWKAGAAALCPHLNTRCFQGAAADHLWLDGDLELLSRCDAVLMTEDWQRSSGARAERDHAEREHITVVYSLVELEDWLRGWQQPA